MADSNRFSMSFGHVDSDPEPFRLVGSLTERIGCIFGQNLWRQIGLPTD